MFVSICFVKENIRIRDDILGLEVECSHISKTRAAFEKSFGPFNIKIHLMKRVILPIRRCPYGTKRFLFSEPHAHDHAVAIE